MKRITIARNIAAVATTFTVFGFILSTLGIHVGEDIGILSIMAGLLSYIFGGLGTALKSAWKIAATGWYIIPIFPIDIFTFVITFGVAIIIFVYAPIIPVMMAYKQQMAMEEA